MNRKIQYTTWSSGFTFLNYFAKSNSKISFNYLRHDNRTVTGRQSRDTWNRRNTDFRNECVVDDWSSDQIFILINSTFINKYFHHSLTKWHTVFYCSLLAVHGEGNGTPLQYSCLENPMDGGAWWAAVHGVARGQTRLSDFTFTFHFHALEKEMATHSSVLAWRIPGAGEPGGLLSMGSNRVGHDWSDLAVALAVHHTSFRMRKASSK